MDVVLVSLTSVHQLGQFIISSVQGAFSLSTNVHAQNIVTRKLVLRGIVKKIRKFQCLTKKNFLERKRAIAE